MKNTDLPTVAALAALAFIATDVAHETLGHGAGFLLAGGREGILTTTRLITSRHFPSPGWRVFDLGGPAGNLLWASCCLFATRSLRGRAPRLSLFLWAGAMFGFFWEFGYAMKAAITGDGDYMALVTGCAYPLVARMILFLAGLFLYRAAIGWLARSFPLSARSADPRVRLTIYLAGGLVACAGPIFDPRGAAEIFNSGFLTGFLSAVGIWFMASPAARDEAPPPAIARSLLLISLAIVALLLFVLVLGPGIPFAT